MVYQTWQLQPEQILRQSPIIPVITPENPQRTVSLAKALLDGGLSILEITLRTSSALECIRILTEKFPDALIGAGTVLNPKQLQQAVKAGAKFVLSPGLTPDLLKAGKDCPIPLIPGLSHTSEIMTAIEFGYQYFKFFPAEAAGGRTFLKSIYGPLPDIRFCPTGGINAQNYRQYLNLPNVACVGGSWMMPEEVIKNQDWQKLSAICHKLLAEVKDHSTV